MHGLFFNMKNIFSIHFRTGEFDLLMKIFLKNKQNIRVHRQTFGATHAMIESLSTSIVELFEILDSHGLEIIGIKTNTVLGNTRTFFRKQEAVVV